MVFVPSGTFQMGSAANDPLANEGEFPQHPITVNEFWIDNTEVTNAQYLNCVSAGSCWESRYANDTNYNDGNSPVVGVSWQDAADYCKLVSGRLPRIFCYYMRFKLNKHHV